MKPEHVLGVVLAQFNLGCAQAKLKQWPAAAAAIKSSINDYGLKLTVAVLVSFSFSTTTADEPILSCETHMVCVLLQNCVDAHASDADAVDTKGGQKALSSLAGRK